jgi:hypothetical protein
MAICKEHINNIAFCMDQKDFPTDTHTLETAMSLCAHCALSVCSWPKSKPFADESSMILFAAACFSVACKFCQSVVTEQMYFLQTWMDSVHDRFNIAPHKRQHNAHYALFNMEVSILDSIDWCLGKSTLGPTSSGLLFLTGRLHVLPEESIQVMNAFY